MVDRDPFINLGRGGIGEEFLSLELKDWHSARVVKLGKLKQRIVCFFSTKTCIVFTLACVKCSRRSTMVPAFLCIHSLFAGEAAAGVNHASSGHFSTGELFGDPTPAGVTVDFSTVVLLPNLVVEEESR